jgi:hypothetical protein
MVSVLTLAHAGHEVIETLYRLRGLEPILFDSIKIKDEYHQLFRSFLKDAPNFVKHADRDPDPDATTGFHIATVEMFILASCVALQRMGIDRSCEERAYMYWLLLQKPHLFDNPPPDPKVRFIRDSLRTLPKKVFFDEYIAKLKNEQALGVGSNVDS